MQLIINARREGYATDQCPGTMTVGDLINFLQEFNESTPVFLSHDNGYTYGSVRQSDFKEREEPREEIESEEQ